MTTVSVSNSFVAGTDIESAEVNQNFDDLTGYLNSEVIVRDASVAFTAIPSGPGTDPTNGNQFTRKQYVDNAVNTLDTDLQGQITTNTTDITKRPRIYRQDTTSTAPTELTNPKFYTGSFTGTTDADGRLSFVYGTAFGTLVSAVVSNGDEASASMIVELRSNVTTGFTVQCRSIESVAPFGTTVLNTYANMPVRINYFAIGY